MSSSDSARLCSAGDLVAGGFSTLAVSFGLANCTGGKTAGGTTAA